MGPKRRYLAGLLIAAVCAGGATAGPAAAKRKPKPPQSAYRSGVYSGTVEQRMPDRIVTPIRFQVSGRTLSGLNVTMAEVCGFVLRITVTEAPKDLHVPIARDGSFSYDRTVLGDHLQIKGRARGRQAAGTLFDSLTSGQLACAMTAAAPFTAKH